MGWGEVRIIDLKNHLVILGSCSGHIFVPPHTLHSIPEYFITCTDLFSRKLIYAPGSTEDEEENEIVLIYDNGSGVTILALNHNFCIKLSDCTNVSYCNILQQEIQNKFATSENSNRYTEYKKAH